MAKLEPYLTARAIRPLVSALRTLGYDAGPILKSLGVDPADLADPDAHVPMSVGVGLLRDAVEMTDDKDIGLHLAERVDLGEFDVHF